MGTTGVMGTRMRLVLLATIGALALVLAAPALAQNESTKEIDQDCDASEGDCSNQASSDGQDADDEDRDIRQVQIFEGDDVHRHVHRDRHRDRANDAVTTTTTDEFDCTDFSSQEDAQARLDNDTNDPHGLDSDNDGSACEEFFTQAVTVEPRGGVETGGGGTLAANGGSPAATAAMVGGPLAALLLVGGLLGLRRGRLS